MVFGIELHTISESSSTCTSGELEDSAIFNSTVVTLSTRNAKSYDRF